jgi:hypothetical protein
MQSNRALQIPTLLLTLLPTIGMAAGPGMMVVHGKATTFTDAYAYHHPASYDKNVTQATIILTDKKIDAAKLKAAGGDFDKAVHDWLDQAKVAYWEVIFYPDGTLWMGNVSSPGVFSSYGSAGCAIQMTRNDAQRAEGSCRTEDEKQKDDKDDGVYVDAKFALDF